MFNWSILQTKLKYSFDKVVPALYRAGYYSKAKKISSCGHYKELAVCQNCGEKYLNGFNTCKDRFCPICEKKRSYLWLAKLSPIISQFLEEKKIVNMVTFTIVDEPILKNQLEIITKCWRYLVHDDKILRKEFKERFQGGLRALEVKRGKFKGLWHCHFHCLVIKDNYSRDFDWLKSAWQKAYKTITGKQVSLQVRVDNIQSNCKGHIGAILEVVKYVTKFDWQFNDDVKELVDSLNHVRTISTWGNLRSKLSEEDIEKDMDLTLSETIQLVCKACGNTAFDYIEGITSNNMSVTDYTEEEL